MKYNIVLGGGISGLLMLEILKGKNYIMFAKENSIGGQLKNDFPLGPRILHYNQKTKAFLESIGINETPRIYKVGYLVGNELKSQITAEERLRYYVKTRGNSNINATTMSEGKTQITGWDLNKLNLVEVLYERNKHLIYPFDVNTIEVNNKLINNKYEYDNLTSTIPLEALQKIVQIQNKITYDTQRKDVYFHHVKYAFIFEGYDYIYSVDGEFNRITKINDREHVIEASRLLSMPANCLQDLKVANTQIVNELKLTDYHGIKLVGRYAQYDHGIKTNNIIEKYW